MKIEELNAIVERSKTGEASVADVVAIVASSFESSSRHNKEIRKLLSEANGTLVEMKGRMERLERHVGSPVWRLGHDDEESGPAIEIAA